jgi:hypothetical protein
MSQLQVTGEAKIRDIQGPVVANSGVITALDGAASQYVRGDGTLADFPTSSGGGSSVSYYLNSSVSQGTIGGVAYRELNKEPIIGAGTDIAISTTGYVASYLTDANDPDVLSIPGGNFNCEFYFSVNNNTGNPFFYAELYKYDGTTFTLLGSSVGVPEYINQGTIIAPYYFAIPVATAALALTDRLAIRIYVNVDGRTVTLHTENGHLCQVVTTLSKGMVSLNNLTDQSQFITTGTSGTDFNIVSSGDTHTFNIPSASASNRGLITTGSQTIAGIKTLSVPSQFEQGLYLKQNMNLFQAGYIGLGASTTGLIVGLSGGGFGTLNFNNTTSFTYTFPDASGTIALTSNLSSYVPYTGATASVNLGGNSLSASALTVATNLILNSTFLLKKAGLGVTTPTYVSQFAATTGVGIGYSDGTGGGNFIFPTASINDYTYPAITGTLALLEGTQTFSGSKTFSVTTIQDAGIVLKNGVSPTPPTGYVGLSSNGSGISIVTRSGITTYNNNLQFTSTSSNDYNFPNVTGVMAMLEGTQTFSGAKTFSLDILVNGLTVGRGGGSISTNTVLGATALSSNTTGASNVAIGINSLNTNTTGGSNVAVGQSSLQTNNSNQNTAIGNQAMQFNTTGTANTGIGHTALQNNTTGNNNIAIGYESGKSITTGSNNTIIGNYAGTTTLANNIVLADGAGTIRYQWNGTFNNFNGDAAFSGAITATSSIKGLSLQIQNAGFVSIITSTPTATRSIVVPDASGTLALTSDLSAYLPLSGGTLTGALSGTSATFNHNDAPTIRVQRNGGTDSNTVLEFTNASRSFFIGSNGTVMGLGGTSGAVSSQPLQISSTGAATFSSSIAATSATFSGLVTINSNIRGLAINRDAVTNYNGIGYQTAGVQQWFVGMRENLSSNNYIIYNENGTDALTISKSDSAATFSSTITAASTLYLGYDGTYGSTYRTLGLTGITNGTHRIFAGTTDNLYIAAATSRGIEFWTDGSSGTKMLITSGGDVLIGDTTASANLWVKSSAAGNTFGARNTNASFAATVAFLGADRNTTNNSFYYIDCYNYGSGTYRFRVADSGNVTNTNNSYGAISDIKLKENIVDASPKLNDLLKVKIKNFNYIGSEEKQLGVIAQELEKVFPSMIEIHNDKDGEGNDLGTTTKSVKYSVFVPMLIKAIQEQQAQIEELKQLIKNK